MPRPGPGGRRPGARPVLRRAIRIAIRGSCVREMCVRRIPEGFRRPAQGCEERATLGQSFGKAHNPQGVAPRFVDTGHNPFRVAHPCAPYSQGSSFLATLGWRTQSLWDWDVASRVHFGGGFVVGALVCGGDNSAALVSAPVGTPGALVEAGAFVSVETGAGTVSGVSKSGASARRLNRYATRLFAFWVGTIS